MTAVESITVYATYALAMAYYAFAFYLAVTNIWRFIVGQKRYKESGGSFLTLFYAFSLGIIIPRAAQLSCQVFLNQAIYYYITYYVSLIVGMNLNAVILVVAFMLFDLKSVINTLNIPEATKNRSQSFWLSLFLIGVTDLPIFVCYFMPGFTEKQT